MKDQKFIRPQFGGYAAFVSTLYEVASQGQEAIDAYIDEFIDVVMDHTNFNYNRFTESKRDMIYSAFRKRFK